MKATSADILEYESLRGLLGRYVSSPLGKAELVKIAPHTDAARLAVDLAEAGEAVQYLRSAARPQPAVRGAAIRIEFSGIPDLTEAVHKLRIEGASLEAKEIFDLFAVLDRAADELRDRHTQRPRLLFRELVFALIEADLGANHVITTGSI